MQELKYSTSEDGKKLRRALPRMSPKAYNFFEKLFEKIYPEYYKDFFGNQ